MSTALLRAGDYQRAKLLLNTILQAHPACVQAHVQLVHTHLHLEQSLWPKALQIARCVPPSGCQCCKQHQGWIRSSDRAMINPINSCCSTRVSSCACLDETLTTHL